MPEFDSTHDSPAEYIEKLLHKVENKGWEVERSTHLTNLSFLKINMYKDLERNEEKINANPVIAALVGEQDPIQVPEELNNFDHDRCRLKSAGCGATFKEGCKLCFAGSSRNGKEPDNHKYHS